MELVDLQHAHPEAALVQQLGGGRGVGAGEGVGAKGAAASLITPPSALSLDLIAAMKRFQTG